MKCLFKVFLLIIYLLRITYAAPCFLTLSDIHYGKHNGLGDAQDTGPEFLKTTMIKFKKLSKNVDFILYLGDLPTHSFFKTLQKKTQEETVFESLYQNDVAAKPLFYVPGNNDSLFGNYQPFEEEGISPLNFATHWSGACAYCKGLMIDDSHMYHGGYYATYVTAKNKKIMLIALNATQWANTPFFSPYPHQEKDALMQLSWLERQLKKHSTQQLLIAMHEPPGNSYKGKPIWVKRYLEQFITLLNKNKHRYGEITLLTSHSHMDEIRAIHLSDGSTLYAYSVPGISRIHHNYPGMKTFTLNKKLQIKNFTTYYTSHLNAWGSQHYRALSAPGAIFPHCRNKTLSQCLNQLNSKQVCDYLDKGLFYGVKSPTVRNNACNTIFKVY